MHGTFVQQLFVGTLNIALPIHLSHANPSLQAPTCIQAERANTESHATIRIALHRILSDNLTPTAPVQSKTPQIENEKYTTMPPPIRPATKPSPSTTTPTATTTRPRSPETHASLALRNTAAETLQSYEQLSWHALSRNEVRQFPQIHTTLTQPLTNHLSLLLLVPSPNPPPLPLPARRLHCRRRERTSQLENRQHAARAGRPADFDIHWSGAVGRRGQAEEQFGG